MADPKYPVHPLVKKLDAGGGAEAAVKLLGYFGGDAGEGVVKIYSSLDDLSVYFEVQTADILHVEAADPTELAHGGSAIWLKAGAQVQRCVTRRTSTQAGFLAGSIAARMAGGPAVAYRSAARAPFEPDTAACEGFSIWPCSVLIGACLASNDMPCAYTDAWWCQQVGTADVNTCIPTCAGYTCNYLCRTVNPWQATCGYTCGRACFPITRVCEVATGFCR
jgi:hypothetical protein